MKILNHPDSAQTIEVTDESVDRYLLAGWREATEGAPKGNASLSEWQEFARSQGMAESEIEGVSRDDLRAALS